MPIDGPNRAWWELTGPVSGYVQLYRLERYNECRSVYTDLIRNSQDEYEEERKTNLAAVVASVSQWETTPGVSVAPGSFYALCF